MDPLIVIFGAAVRPDGQPSTALLRRILYGHAAALAHPDAKVLCSGGVGKADPSEASVMMRLLMEKGVAADRLIADEASLDTLQSVVETARLVRAGAASRVIVCSDAYHLPRIRMMLAALGIPSSAGPAPRGRYDASLRHNLRMTLREGLAIPYDLAIVLARRRALVRPAS